MCANSSTGLFKHTDVAILKPEQFLVGNCDSVLILHADLRGDRDLVDLVASRNDSCATVGGEKISATACMVSMFL